jgi:hypothetical protein
MIVCEHSSLLTHVNGVSGTEGRKGGKAYFLQFFGKTDTYIGKNAYICKQIANDADIHV